MSLIFWMLIGLVAAFAARARAADANARLQNFVIAPEIGNAWPASAGLLDQVRFAVGERVDEEFANLLHPLSTLNWNVRFSAGDPRSALGLPAGGAQRAFSRSLLGGLREATVDLPILAWLQDRQDFLVGLFENSIGGFDEEAVAPLSLSYHRAERSWWETLSRDNRIRYGIRPLRADPYAYFSLGLKDGDRTWLLMNVRYRYVDFGDHRFEFALSAPLGSGLSLDAGTSYQFGQHDEAKRVALKLCKEFEHGSLLHIGLEVRKRPALIAGITIPL